MTYDAIVMGAGYAGLMAAYNLMRAGQKVLLLAKGYGRTHLATGMVDVLGYANGERVAQPLEAVTQLGQAKPTHPYARLAPDSVRLGVEVFLSAMAEAGYPFAGSLEENALLPTAVGAVRPAAFVPPTMLAGDVREKAPILIVGFNNFKDFYPELIAANLQSSNSPIQARALTLTLPTLENDADLAPMILARAFERADFRRKLATLLKPQLKAGERVGFPAVLGIDKALEVLSDLQTQLGVRVFEIPSLPPSIPGIRICHALEKLLRQGGARVQIGHPIVEVRVSGTKVEAVAVKSAARLKWYTARQFVLATGGIAAHGIEVDSTGAARETLFNLPLANVPAPGQPRFNPAYFAEHPFSEIGLPTDSAMRPLDANGQPVLENLRVCGALLAGAEPWKEKSGEGISLASAYQVALSIRKKLNVKRSA
ncbi:MAG: glycerol-3-phosphate dehydrogenase subunit GlpB [Anaerolineales bacterium]|nr:glycerol-3-phosphate dehydrogenase subunit GlpB [Anaerolineales bacterium]